MRSVDLRDLVGGLVVAAVGGAFAIAATEFPPGRAGQIGPGFVPTAVGLITVGLGLLIAGRAFLRTGPLPRPALRPVLAVFAAVAVFGLLVQTTGLGPAVMGTTAVAASGSAISRPLPVAILAIFVAIGCWLVFIAGLGLPVDFFRNPF